METAGTHARRFVVRPANSGPLQRFQSWCIPMSQRASSRPKRSRGPQQTPLLRLMGWGSGVEGSCVCRCLPTAKQPQDSSTRDARRRSLGMTFISRDTASLAGRPRVDSFSTLGILLPKEARLRLYPCYAQPQSWNAANSGPPAAGTHARRFFGICTTGNGRLRKNS